MRDDRGCTTDGRHRSDGLMLAQMYSVSRCSVLFIIANLTFASRVLASHVLACGRPCQKLLQDSNWAGRLAEPLVAPQGREGIWTALASAPLFAAKLPTGVISGQLLQSLCPAPGACPAELGTADSGSGAVRPSSLWSPRPVTTDYATVSSAVSKYVLITSYEAELLPTCSHRLGKAC